MFKSKILTAVLLGAMAVSVSGFKPAPKDNGVSTQLGTVLDKSGPKPEWVEHADGADSHEQDGKMYFVAFLDNQKKLSVAMDHAQARAMANVRKSVIAEIETAFAHSTETSSNDLEDEGAVDDGTSASRSELFVIAKRLHLPGIKQEGSYWEKVVSKNADGETVPGYKVWVLVSIPAKYYKKAQSEAAKAALGFAEKTKNEKAKRALREQMEELKSGEE